MAETTSKERVRPRPRPLPLPSVVEGQLSPRSNNASSLYDSFELRAVTYQLNKAMHRASSSSPAYMCYLKSPFCSQWLDRLNRENSRAPKKVVCSHLTCATINRDEINKRKTKGGFATKLWNKLKQGLLLRSINNNNHKQRKELSEM